VAGTSNALAVEAGADALRKGGTAMDACAAVAAAEVVLATGSYVSFAGISEITYYSAQDDTVYAVHGNWNNLLDPVAPAEIPRNPQVGPQGKSVLVPRFFPALEAAVARFARFPLATLLEPAIYFAEQGILVDSLLSNVLKAFEKVVTRTAAGTRLFTNPATGRLYTTGDTFYQPEVAALLRNISTFGVGTGMYEGAWGRAMVAAVSAENGTLSAQDLVNRAAQLTSEPLSTVFAPAGSAGDTFAVFTAGQSNFGGTLLIEQLNLVEASGLLAHPGALPVSSNATTLFWMMQITMWTENLAVTVAAGYPGAWTSFYPELNVTDAHRRTKEYAAQVWSLLTASGGVARFHHALCTLQGGGSGCSNTSTVPDPIMAPQGATVLAETLQSYRATHSDAVVAIDAEGNVCSMMHSMNSEPWGSGIVVQGVALSNAAATNYAYMAHTRAGDPVPGPVMPLLVMKKPGTADGTPAVSAALSVVGASLGRTTLQHLISILVGGMDAQEALDAPTFLLNQRSTATWRAFSVVEQGRYSAEVLSAVRGMGQQVLEVDHLTFLQTQGVPVALRVIEGNTQEAGSVNTLNGAAVGV